MRLYDVIQTLKKDGYSIRDISHLIADLIRVPSEALREFTLDPETTEGEKNLGRLLLKSPENMETHSLETILTIIDENR